MNTKRLVEHIIQRASGRKRHIVAIAGPPGAGKSTFAQELLEMLTKKAVRARIISMDGFHLDNLVLAERGLLARKGAPATFDVMGFVHLMKRLTDLEADVAIPTFDRKRDLSIAGADIISAQDTVLIVEGNYLLLKEHPWAGLTGFWDETIFIDPGAIVLEKRLLERWLEHGLDAAAAKTRAMSNDIPNAHYVLDNSSDANIQIT